MEQDKYPNGIEELNKKIRSNTVRRAIKALRAYEGQEVILVIRGSKNSLSHTCRGKLEIADDGWVSVDRNNEDGWTQWLAFDPTVVASLRIELGTTWPSILATMYESDVQGSGDRPPAIVPSSSGA